MHSTSDPDSDSTVPDDSSPESSGPEQTPAEDSPGQSTPGGALDKFRIRFRKDGSLRLLSHHDLLRTFERMLRRAELPFRRTKGFNPRPRLVFALSLPLGVIGCSEVVELEMDAVLPSEEVHQALNRQTPPGLAILDVKKISPKTTARVRALCYAVALPADVGAGVRERIPEVLGSGACWVERTRPPRRRLDIRPFLRELRVRESGVLEMELWLTPAGTARPEEVLSVLGVPEYAGDGAAGAVLKRAWLELEDEQTAHPNLNIEKQQRPSLPPDDPAPAG